MIPRVTAFEFDRQMSKGRTEPFLLVCHDVRGESVEVVTKLKGHPKLHPGGLASELFCAQLAHDMAIDVPPPCIVEITPEFLPIVPESCRHLFKSSLGDNFGSPFWAPGFGLWPDKIDPPAHLLNKMGEILAFDALIQNTDRKADNPNCVLKGDQILLYDHECAFSNLLNIFPVEGWTPQGLSFMHSHVFKHALRNHILDLGRFKTALDSIDESLMLAYSVAIPEDWNGPKVHPAAFTEHLLSVKANFSKFHHSLKGIL